MTRRDTANIVNSRSRDYWERQIRQWVHNEIDRRMLELQLLDGLSLNEITYRIQDYHTIEYDQVKKRLARAKNQLFSHMERAE